MPSFNIKDYVIPLLLFAMFSMGVTIAGLWWSNSSLESDLKVMEDKRDDALKDIGLEKANNILLKNTIKTQNDKITAFEVSEERNLVELQEWKNKKPEVRYNTIYKEIPKEIRIKDISCEEIKNISKSLDGFDLNTL